MSTACLVSDPARKRKRYDDEETQDPTECTASIAPALRLPTSTVKAGKRRQREWSEEEEQSTPTLHCKRACVPHKGKRCLEVNDASEAESHKRVRTQVPAWWQQWPMLLLSTLSCVADQLARYSATTLLTSNSMSTPVPISCRAEAEQERHQVWNDQSSPE